MSCMRKRSQHSQKVLEDGWQSRQERQKNRTHNRTLRTLRKNFQVYPRQEKNLVPLKKHQVPFFFLEPARIPRRYYSDSSFLSLFPEIDGRICNASSTILIVFATFSKYFWKLRVLRTVMPFSVMA